MAFIIISVVSVVALYLQTLWTGMPRKRWLSLALVMGPLALILFRVHYRRAWMRRCASLVMWRA
ncbi:hypothetical protein [Pseudoalteromonas piscicida]|uniref:Uncharacterized protein n=1 Tax=Pseudoalteromonas piscicida TaxID=43662 RepID=A0A2A5JS47_PSEO7|nr:hypothetical protein [Pseudoalteromonas piscicida]PCK32091.1 hypothetical protein CEX98_08880 [Pseudoalteromonas piscicida]